MVCHGIDRDGGLMNPLLLMALAAHNLKASDDWSLGSINTGRWSGDTTHFEVGDYSGSYAGNELRVKAASMPTKRTITNTIYTSGPLDYRMYFHRTELASEPSGTPDSDLVTLTFPGGTLIYSSNFTAMGNDGAYVITPTNQAPLYPVFGGWPQGSDFTHIWIERSGDTLIFKTGDADFATATIRLLVLSSPDVGADTSAFSISSEGSNGMGFMTDWLLTDTSGNDLYI
jgi:hypothetical protein